MRRVTVSTSQCHLLWLIGLGLTLSVASNSVAQERRGRSQPILRLKSDAPIGTVRQLKFTEDKGQLWLFSAGDDKVVRRWKASLGAEPALEPAGQFHWPIYLAERGNIHALDVIQHPTAGELIAVGGIGYAPSLVALIPVDNPEAMRLLYDPDRNQLQRVRSLSFGRNANNEIVLASAESSRKDGDPADVVLWNVTNLAAPVLLGRLKTNLQTAELVAVHPQGSHLVVAGRSNNDPAKTPAEAGSEVEVWDIGTRSRFSSHRLRSVQADSLFKGGIGWLADGSWACGSLIGAIHSKFPSFNNSNDDVMFAGTYGVLRSMGSDPNAVEIRNSTGSSLSIDSWEANGRTKPHQQNLTIAAGQNRLLGKGLPGLFVDALVSGKPENPNPHGCPKGKRLEYLSPELAVAGLATLPPIAGKVSEWIVCLRDSKQRGLLYRQKLGGQPVLLDPNDAGFDCSQSEPVAVAVSPDGQFAAAAGRGEIAGGLPVWQIRVWSLETGKLLVEYPDRKDETRAYGGPIEAVAVDPGDHKKLAFRHGREWKQFHLVGRILPASVVEESEVKLAGAFTTSLAPVMDRANKIGEIPAGTPFEVGQANGEWLAATHGGKSGWVNAANVATRTEMVPDYRSVRFQNDAFQWTFASSQNARLTTPLVPHKTGIRPRVATRLQRGGADPLDLLAVAYSEGLLLWDLRAATPRVVRSFYTHESPVTCMCFSGDGRLLVTGAADGTIAGWRIEGFKTGNELGVTIDANGFVTSVAEGSPGWEAGFTAPKAGQKVFQQIIKVSRNNQVIEQNLWQSAIQRAEPGINMEVYVRAPDPGKPGAFRQDILITPVKWDPIWNYAPRYDNDWVLWTPQGQLETKAILRNQPGAALPLEWQVGLLRARVGQEAAPTPRIFDAGVFLRMNADRHVGGKSMGDVLDEVMAEVKAAPADSPPFPDVDLRIEPGSDQTPPRITSLDVSVPDGHSLEKIELWINSFRLDAGAVDALRNGVPKVPVDLSKSGALRGGVNNVIAVTTLRVNGVPDDTGRRFFQDVRRFTRPPAAGLLAAKIHFVGCGVAEPDPALKLQKLKFPGKDVRDIHDTLAEMVPQARRGHFAMMVDHAAGDAAPVGKNLLNALKQLSGKVQPEDLAIVMLSGHGDINKTTGKFEYITADGPVDADRMNDVLASLKCRTVLLLDTCHSAGVAGASRQIQDFARLLPGPMVVTSCGRDQISIEHAALQNGFFTAALKEGLTGVSPESLGQLPELRRKDPLTLPNLFEFVEQRTPVYLNKLSVKNKQVPQRIDSLGFPDADRYALK